jgi:hypothetical protein
MVQKYCSSHCSTTERSSSDPAEFDAAWAERPAPGRQSFLGGMMPGLSFEDPVAIRLSARFSLMDFPGFFVSVFCRDLSPMTTPSSGSLDGSGTSTLRP